MRIGMVLDKDYLSDMRVVNEAEMLAKNGYKVYILYSADTKAFSELENIHLIHVNINSFLRKKLRALTNTIFNLYPYIWAYHIIKLIKQYRIDVLHVHDLYMFKSGFVARNFLKSNLHIVGDLHENYVEALKGYKFSNSFIGRLLISINKWSHVEKKWIEELDSAICVIEEAFDRYKKITSQRNFYIVPNYVRLEDFRVKNVRVDIKSQSEKNFTILYSGAFDKHRGLTTLINSIPIIRKTIENIFLVLVGDGPNMDELKKLTLSLDINDHIFFAGWQKPVHLPDFISKAEVCVIPHLKSIHTDNTIPHKLFHYMALKKPVITSDCIPMKRIVNETRCGLVFKSNNELELANHIISLYRDPMLINEMGENGYKAVRNKYNWQKAGENLLKMYKDIEMSN